MIHDIGIIGSGVAGTFAALRILEKHSAKAILFDIGRPPGKRRRQIEGFLGCLPTGDGKIYPDDLEEVKNLVDGRKAGPAYNWVKSYLGQVNKMKLIKSPKVSAAAKKKFKKAGFEVDYHDYYQWKPESVHSFSKVCAEIFEDNNKLTYSFDNEVFSIRKQKGNVFVVDSADGQFLCKKILICVGRSGWRWVTNLYDDLGIISNDDWAQFGIRAELNAADLSYFNKAHCFLYKDDVELGPFQWGGTIIPEDHSDLVISAFRSNEDRWKSLKVSFSLLRTRFFDDAGSVQTDRIGKLAFLLSNDRISKEKIKSFLSGKSPLNLIPEYEWLHETLRDVGEVIPELLTKGSFYAPHINPKPAEIRIGPCLETEIDGMYVAGEAAGIQGIAAAAIMGTVAADSACK